MDKVELAKMLGLSLDDDWEIVEDYLPTGHTETSELLKLHTYGYKRYSFNNKAIEITVEEKLVNTLRSSRSKYNVSDRDWERYYKVSFVKEYNDMVWELAANTYLSKINKLVETLKL